MAATNFDKPWQRYLRQIAAGAGIEIEALTVTENDTYTAPAGKAYSPVIVNVSGGGGSTEYDIKYYNTLTEEYAEDLHLVYEAEWDDNDYDWVASDTGVSEAAAGKMLMYVNDETNAFDNIFLYSENWDDSGNVPATETLDHSGYYFIMPNRDAVIGIQPTT